jgi:hypothetical protein
MCSLKITPVPFRSSKLAIPPSPFSPLSPLTPASRSRTPCSRVRYGLASAESLKFSPLLWMWQCHQCRQTYPLGTTRRCLEDGHHFCSGTSLVNSRKYGNRRMIKKHSACASEFDYAAWKTIGDWRRERITSVTPSIKTKKDCWHSCNYPSECRWGNQLSQNASLIYNS